jgi:hypothetical protein
LCPGGFSISFSALPGYRVRHVAYNVNGSEGKIVGQLNDMNVIRVSSCVAWNTQADSSEHKSAGVAGIYSGWIFKVEIAAPSKMTIRGTRAVC